MQRSRGAVLIETVLVLPVILVMILMIMWLGTILSAAINLHWAVGEGLRLAITRGEIRRVGTHIIPGLNYYSLLPIQTIFNDPIIDKTFSSFLNFSAPSASPDAKLTSLLAFNVTRTEMEVEDFYLNYSVRPVFTAWTGATFSRIPPQMIYALGYVNEAMRQSVGRQVKFPCNPAGGTHADDGGGCLRCTFLNPNTLDTSPDTVSTNIPLHRIGLECVYASSLTFLAPLNRLFQLLIGGAGSSPLTIRVRSRKFIEVETSTALEAVR